MKRLFAFALLVSLLWPSFTAFALAPLADAEKVALLNAAKRVEDAVVDRDLEALQRATGE